MDIKEQQRIDSNNFQRHPWEVVRLKFVLDVLKKQYKNNPGPSSILDIGGGDLYVSEAISDDFLTSKIVSMDTAHKHFSVRIECK